MKNAFVLTHLFLGGAWLAAFATQFAGVLPFDVLSLPVCIGSYVAAATLALAFQDYFPRRTSELRRRPRHAAQPKRAVASPGIGVEASTWGYRTLSA